MEFKELTEKDFKTEKWLNTIECTCGDDNNVVEYKITYREHPEGKFYEKFPDYKYCATVEANYEEIWCRFYKSLEKAIDELNKFRKELIQDLMEVPNAKKD
jgi:hypothetical protein